MQRKKLLVVLAILSTSGTFLWSAVDAFAVIELPRNSVPRTSTVRTYSAHEFWGTPRSAKEVKGFVEYCLEESVQGSSIDEKPVVDVVAAGESPLVVIHNCIPLSMCRQIIQSAAGTDNLKRSTTGESNKKSDTRTSSTVWLRDEDCQQPLRLIADMVSRISGLPPSYMENLQVCRYLPGQEFKLHTDHLDSFNHLDCRGRLATCLVYLSEPASGGETWFPGLRTDDDDADAHNETQASLEPKISPSQGSAVFFWNTIEKPGSPGYHPSMFLNVDVRLRHAGLPVLEGEKWICNRWVHPIPLDMGVRGVHPPVVELPFTCKSALV